MEMNWHQLVQEQSRLETLTLKARNLQAADLQANKFVGLLVEVSELANTFAAFKYWKRSHVTNHEKLIKEFADSLTFLCAFAGELKLQTFPPAKVASEELTTQTLELFNAVVGLSFHFAQSQLSKALALYLGLMQLLKVEEESVQTVFLSENAARQAALVQEAKHGF